MRLLLLALFWAGLATSVCLGHEPVPGSNPQAAVPAAAAPLNLNAATLEQLDTLPGIGPALAERIIAYRDEHGPFTAIEQLDAVKGIGPRTLAELRPLLTVE